MTQHPQVFQNVCLQGELQKTQILELLQQYGLIRLTNNFIPDFLLHSPGTGQFHPYVVEVKADQSLTRRQVLTDLSKLTQFMTRYAYQRGIFLATIISNDELFTNLISQNLRLLTIQNIQQVADRIFIVSKRGAGDQTHYELLSNLIDF